MCAMPERNLSLIQNQEVSATDILKRMKPGDIQVIKQTCLPHNATDEELALFMYRCKTLGLDPFNKELVMQKYSNKDGSVTISFITTRDGYIKCAEFNPDYLGINSGVVREGDYFSFDAKEGSVEHKFGMKRGNIIGAWAIAYHRSRKPNVQFVDFLEYSQANLHSPVWKKVPSAMIQKVAEVAALRRQFPISGLYTSDEMGDESNNTNDQPKHIQPEDSTSQIIDQQLEISSDNECFQLESVTENTQGHPKEPFKVLQVQAGSSGNNTPFLKFTLQNYGGQTAYVFAVGSMIEKIDHLELGEGSMVYADFESQGNVNMLTDMDIA